MMDLREHALKLALISNAEETSKWEFYKSEQESARSNINEFVKKCEIDVMVPIGTKALMKGTLYHTNEILANHFQGYFSKVSSHKALEIISYRIKSANDRLKAYETEHNLYHNKLDLPNANEEGTEIIEDFNEETESEWKRKHKENVRKMKQNEARDRISANNEVDDDIMNLFDELELREELEEEFDQIGSPNDDDSISQLLSSEISIPPARKRISNNDNSEVQHEQTQNENKKIEKSDCSHATKCNVYDANRIDNNDGDTDDEDIPEEFKILADKAKLLSRHEKLWFYKNELKVARKLIRKKQINTPEDVMQSIKNIEMKNILEEVIEDLLYSSESEDESSQSNNSDTKVTNQESLNKKRIRFSENVQYEQPKSASNKITLCETPQISSLSFDIPLHKVAKTDYDENTTLHLAFNHTDSNYIPTSFNENETCSPLEIYLKFNKEFITKNRPSKKSSKTSNNKIATTNSDESKSYSVEPLKSILKKSISGIEAQTFVENSSDDITTSNCNMSDETENDCYPNDNSDYSNVSIFT